MKKIILLIPLIFFLIFGLSGLYGNVKEYKDGEVEYIELEQYVRFDMESVEELTIEEYNKEDAIIATNETKVDFNKLKNINSDCIGWIYIPNTNINYPIVNGIDNRYYVTHTFKKNENKAGSIFLDMRNSLDLSDKNNIIYGHNLKNNKMFSDLRRVLEKDYFNNHKRIIIYTENKELIYETFAVFKTMEDSNIYKVKFSSDNAFLEHIDMLINDSNIKFNGEKQDIKKIITLSTCTNSLEGERVVVIARLIEEMESNNEL